MPTPANKARQTNKMNREIDETLKKGCPLHGTVKAVSTDTEEEKKWLPRGQLIIKDKIIFKPICLRCLQDERRYY
jgi:hypothetical protein